MIGASVVAYPTGEVDRSCHISDSLTSVHHRKTFFHRIGKSVTRLFQEFNNIDTNYIEPQRYNYTVMLQSTNTYEMYKLSEKDGNSITFAPEVSYKLGPYVGWRWIFLGYTIDLKHICMNSEKSNRKEFGLSLYSSLVGVDLFWRETGNNYRIRSLDLEKNINTDAIKNVDFDGLNSSIKGFNLYYIFNHRRFSYPAAYSQSTVQRHSAGSWLAGIGYTNQKLSMDWNELDKLTRECLNLSSLEIGLDSSRLFGKIEYTDISFSCGYSYNWVFAPHWLFNASLSAALAYKHTLSDTNHGRFTLRDFNLKNINVDGIGRFGLVYNNMKWYAGASAILHSYNYTKKQFSTNNFFGYLNFYIGFNFGKR